MNKREISIIKTVLANNKNISRKWLMSNRCGIMNELMRSFHSGRISADKSDPKFTLTNYSDNDADFKSAFTGKVSKDYVPFHARPGGVPPELRARLKQEKEENPVFSMARTITLSVLAILIFYKYASDQFKETDMEEEILRKTAVVFRRRIMELQVTKGDLTLQKVDVIVNPTNGKLEEEDFLSYNISRRGGEKYLEKRKATLEKIGGELKPANAFVVPSEGGSLMCKNVIHVTGPVWSGGKSKEEDILEKTVFATLAKVDECEGHVVSMPCLSLNFPKRKAAEIMIDSILKYAYERDIEHNTPSSLQVVKIVSEDQEFLDQVLFVWDKKKSKGQLV